MFQPMLNIYNKLGYAHGFAGVNFLQIPRKREIFQENRSILNSKKCISKYVVPPEKQQNLCFGA